MVTRKIFISTQILVTSVVLASILAANCVLLRAKTNERTPLREIAAKAVARIQEEAFWGFMRIDRNSVKLLVFVGSDDKTKGDFDALVIIPELNISLTMRQCGQLAPVIVASSGNSEDQRKSPAEYLNQELKRFSEFINNARRSELVEQISSDPNKIFETNSEFKAKRIKQIKEALNSMTQQPERIQVASFSRFTDQINVLLPIKNEMYTMSVLHQSCGNESVAVGRILPLISIKNELKRKVEAYSTTEDIGSRRKPKRKD